MPRPPLDPGTVMCAYDPAIESAVDRSRAVAYGANGTPIFGLAYAALPAEARLVIDALRRNELPPFDPGPARPFANRHGDLPAAAYHEFTVRTPAGEQSSAWGAPDRGGRRIVRPVGESAFYFTACHYDRLVVGGGGGVETVQPLWEAIAHTSWTYRNGFYKVTALPARV